MASKKIAWWMVSLLSIGISDCVNGQTKATLRKSESIWSGAQPIAETDIVRYKDGWRVACCEAKSADSNEGVIRILSSGSTEDSPWNTLAIIESPTPGRFLSHPRLMKKSEKELVLTAVGLVPGPQGLSEFGGTLQSFVWYSQEGSDWDGPHLHGPANHISGGLHWIHDHGYFYSRGSICGNAQTFFIGSIESTKGIEERASDTVSSFFPGEAALMMKDNHAYCLMSRTGTGQQELLPGLLGVAQAPYKKWEWKEIDSRIRFPNGIQLPDGRIFVTAGLRDDRMRTSLGQLNLEGGRFNEVLELPTHGRSVRAGLVWHDEKLWISLPEGSGGATAVLLLEVSLESTNG